jgi:hypothetical protein
MGYLAECGIEDLAVANAASYETAWNTNQVSAIGFRDVKDCWARNVESFESPHPDADGYHLLSGGIRFTSSKRITITDCTMQKPQHRGGGGNGYLFELRTSNEVLVADCVALKGRHNFIQNWDFGATGMVFLCCFSSGSRSLNAQIDPIGFPAYCDFHHSLAMANLIDSCTLNDGWYAGNRNDWSSGAGHTVTQSVFWNTSGRGQIRSWQFGDGYVIGTRGVSIHTSMFGASSDGTGPEDYVEGADQGAALEPQSLYEDQLARRLSQ